MYKAYNCRLGTKHHKIYVENIYIWYKTVAVVASKSFDTDQPTNNQMTNQPTNQLPNQQTKQ